MTPIALDIKDRKILYILSQEARTPPSVIGKHVGLSKDAVKYRIRQLEKKGIIYNYIAHLDVLPFGFSGYELYIKFNLSPEEEHKVADFFNTHPNIIWSCYTTGEWDYFAELICKSNYDFHLLTQQLSAEFGEALIDFDFHMIGNLYRVTQIVESVYDGKDIDLKNIVKPHEFPAGERIRKLDDTEKKMLKAMADHANLPVHKIAEKSGLTSEVVRYRLKKLRTDGVLIRTSPVIDYEKLGLEEYIIFMDMKNMDKETEKRLRMRIQHNPDTKYAYRALGRLTAVILVNTKTIVELEAFIKELKLEFHKIIKSIRFLHVTSQQHFTLFPPVLQK